MTETFQIKLTKKKKIICLSTFKKYIKLFDFLFVVRLENALYPYNALSQQYLELEEKKAQKEQILLVRQLLIEGREYFL